LAQKSKHEKSSVSPLKRDEPSKPEMDPAKTRLRYSQSSAARA
jgi:hypothetical protein